MVPMFDPMVPDATMLLMVTPSLVGVMVALLVAVAAAIIGMRHELGQTGTARPPRPRPTRHSSAAVPVMRDAASAAAKCAVYVMGGDRLPSGTRIAIEVDRNPWRS